MDKRVQLGEAPVAGKPVKVPEQRVQYGQESVV